MFYVLIAWFSICAIVDLGCALTGETTRTTTTSHALAFGFSLALLLGVIAWL